MKQQLTTLDRADNLVRLSLQRHTKWNEVVQRTAINHEIKVLEESQCGVSREFKWTVIHENMLFQYCNHVINCRVQCAIWTRNSGSTVQLTRDLN